MNTAHARLCMLIAASWSMVSPVHVKIDSRIFGVLTIFDFAEIRLTYVHSQIIAKGIDSDPAIFSCQMEWYDTNF